MPIKIRAGNLVAIFSDSFWEEVERQKEQVGERLDLAFKFDPTLRARMEKIRDEAKACGTEAVFPIDLLPSIN